MKKYLYPLIALMVLFSSCKGKEPSVKEQALTKEERIERRTKELEKIIEESLEKSKKDGKKSGKKSSWGNAPDFTLSTVDGKKLTLSDYAGKVIILDFWATWCGPCRKGIPEFVKLYNDYKNRGFVIIGVNLDRGGGDKVKSFVKDMKINYPVVFGNQRIKQDFGGIRGIPTAFIIDKKGNIAEKIVGYRPGSVFESEIKKLL